MNGVLKALALPVVLFTGWWVLSADSESFYAPPLSQILTAFGDTWTLEQLKADVLPSLLRLFAGFLLAALIGVAAGVAIGSSRRLRAVTEPVLEFFRAIPPPVLVPVIMLFAGIGDAMKVIVIVFGCVWPILLNTVEGVRAVDSVVLETARSYGVTGTARITRVILPSASPQIATGLRQALSIAIILMVISEMFAASNGLGFTIVQFQRSFAIPEMWSGIILLGLLGFGLSLLFRLAERRALRWYEGLRAAQRSS
ncbi:ABC transporter permease [Actinoplanes derwentensis]|uniref:ABC-type nitrate/sulfonate/bicarbonate transport system, permease component n=1 Tax=Actinoplanes derwentensis TaxID=113562 RepID=A0A1H2ALY2_9ACTN|nr:ABC transporter permease [Actinoplanes derwentensis]GID89295.1 nitrate ABC transporter permease [Actinoplanes derwentensis]SDT47008.1 ABC-type nitrate/sulfonate/bicarbonate transport system, permease component [Actinoplanes derwentensis]